MARMPSMRLAVVMLAVAACGGPRSSAEPATDRADARSPGPEAGLRIDSVSDRLASIHDRHRVAAIDRRDFTFAAFWAAVGPVVDASPALVDEVIGRSVEGRPLSSVRFGEGPTRVLLWSQMHGDESTATMALADIFRFVSASPEDSIARRIREALTVVAIPMLNPDGARRSRRRNAQGIDINRDARALATPEGRALERVRERFEPRFGFNLHDQNVRTRVGESGGRAAIALLDPAFNEERDYDPVRRRARRVAAVVRRAVEPLVGDHITRYDDTFNPRAFGDLMQRRGVSTVLIESGGRRDDPEKQYLRKTNFVGILTALHAIAAGTYRDADPAWYEDLPPNGRRLNDLLVLGGEIAVPGREPYRADLAVDYDEPLRREGARIADIGDLEGYEAPDTLDASGLFVHPGPDLLERMVDEERAELRPGVSAELVLRRGPGLSSEAVRTVTGGS